MGDTAERTSDAFAERLLGSALGMFDALGVYLGIKLGLYGALNDRKGMTPAELASAAGCDERYVREWLEQQAVGGVLDVDDAGADAAKRRYALPAAHAEVLLDRDSLNYMAPLVQLLIGAASPLPRLLDAYRSGAGIPYADYGEDVLHGQGEVNRPPFLHLLASEWIPAIPDVHKRLQADPPARIADVGCGVGWSCIGMARGYNKARVDGFDLDPASVEMARANVREAGVADRVDVSVRDAADPAAANQYDLVTAFECIHDMSNPVAALRAMRGLLRAGAPALIVDENVAERFTAPGDDIERLMYGWSMLHCLPAGRAEQPSAATGTVMRPDTLRQYARDAGFAKVEVLDMEHPFFRFYRLSG